MRASALALRFAMFASWLVLQSGCKGEGGAGAAPTESAASSASAAASASPLAALAADASAPLTVEALDAALVALASCTVDDRRIEQRCPAYQSFVEARRHPPAERDPGAMFAKIGANHLADPSPAVRLAAVELIGARADPTTLARVIAAARKEQTQGVKLAMLRVVGQRPNASPEVSKLLLELANAPEPLVRMEAMGYLLAPAMSGAASAFEVVLDKVDHDPSLEVRKYLCTRLYRSGDERAMGVFEKYLKDAAAPPELHDGCLRGLFSAWTGYPAPEKPLERAYALTLAMLRATPRSATRPPWSALSLLRAARTDFPPTDRASSAWYEKVKGWYRPRALVSALAAVATDKRAHSLARMSALDVMKALGATPADFKAVLAKYARAEGDDLRVKHRAELLARPSKSRAPAARPLARPPQRGAPPR
ncbi:MAG: HEAT repeat domain-containing protein [Sorangiineae bacterium]|nr:HEAT repeat domain-containing protein [Polyangiaceae bacterium]MEB2322591.1 HEAT repeat domain-containing protein [Sorangiineae bacterium]